MSFDKKIYFFSRSEPLSQKTDRSGFGIRGRRAVEFAEMDLPVLAGVVIDASAANDLGGISFAKHLSAFFGKFALEVGNEFGNPENPLLIKLVISPNLAIADYPMLHSIGLAEDTFEGFAKKVGSNFAAHEVLFMMKGFLSVAQRIAELEGAPREVKTASERLREIGELLEADSIPPGIELMKRYRNYLPEGFFSSAVTQLETGMRLVSRMFALEEQDENDTAILIQPMVYGNTTADSCLGVFCTRNTATGERILDGYYYPEKFDEVHTDGADINSIDGKYLKELRKIAGLIEDSFREIRQIRFTIENKKLWFIEQRSILQKSTAAQLRLLLDLYKRKIITDRELIQSFKPEELGEVLHPVIDPVSVKKFPSEQGGIAGSQGAAVGRVYFSTETLLDAYRAAKQKQEDTHCILVMPATYAGDVKAIEAADGVLSSEGGYAAHASVVARQYGKISLVRPDMKITGRKAKLGGITFSEGDYITLNVPYQDSPVIYKGRGELRQPDSQNSGVLDLIGICKKLTGGFTVRANADTQRDAETALLLGADGIGLCRTEHMFFSDDRINVFRQMVISETPKERAAALGKLQKMQTGDFYKIFKVMAGKRVTIRLLDAPLHEFLPHNQDELDRFVEFLSGGKGKKVGASGGITKSSILARIDALVEFNPMLGHRGCRIAISYPEIYRMQIRAIFEAVCRLKKEDKITVSPEIMIPLVMNSSELKLIRYGKKIEGGSYPGLADTVAEVFSEQKVKPIPYEVGTMIELPSAALGASGIARYADFFSFGTNDLTQTTLGLSRDDFNSFMPDYTLYDLIDGNPFAVLTPQVKELIGMAADRGKAVRPNLKTGLCGEHGARSENIRFCIDAGLAYVSCSPYSVPVALLSAARVQLEREER
ncbi:MAG: pyruvate, phosphate dikinase [Spirochaetaceae bacterium]|jgi:pyruvate,orthophosphate dikinase|nr:pyruvate, phosphate dikinase [Spirochaetaceae bacterium]